MWSSSEIARRRRRGGQETRFLLQEMQREANTLLSKTPGVESEGLAITTFALEVKSDIEKLREQAQTSNDDRPSASAAGVHCLRALRFGKIHAGGEDARGSRDDVFDLQHHGPPRTRKAPENGMILYPKRNLTAGQPGRVSGIRPSLRQTLVWHSAPFAGESRCKGLDLVLEIDVQGAEQVKQKLPAAVAIFILPRRGTNLSGVCALEDRTRRRQSGAHGAGAAGNPALHGVRFSGGQRRRERAGREVQAIT